MTIGSSRVQFQEHEFNDIPKFYVYTREYSFSNTRVYFLVQNCGTSSLYPEFIASMRSPSSMFSTRESSFFNTGAYFLVQDCGISSLYPEFIAP
jgi:hypothetical protein